MAARIFSAVDLGASGGRVIVGIVEDETVRLEVVHRFPNGVVDVDGHLRWDIERLYDEVVRGLRSVDRAESVGIDTWGVDYGLLDEAGALIAAPISYRDPRTAVAIEGVHATVDAADLYAISGLQFLPFNSIYQLAVDRASANWDRVRHALLMPDLISYWLTGVAGTEVTNASTTGLLDARSHEWAPELLRAIGVPDDLFAPLDEPGTERGRMHDGTPVITVGSHDTASAVVAVPATTDRFAYIASGTWSLVGLELAAPILSEAARDANFTNELGVDGRTRFLRNVGGLWLLQECMRTWQREDLGTLLASAEREPADGPRIDVDDAAFIAPGDMPARIARAAGEPVMSPSRTVRCIVDSLADAYARTLRTAMRISGRSVDVVHIVGGGSQNALLCQLTANACGLPVLAGPVEATALGNVLVQARTAGALPGTLAVMRSRLAQSLTLTRYEPE